MLGTKRRLGQLLAQRLPATSLHAFLAKIAQTNPGAIVEAIGPILNRDADLDSMPFDTPLDGDIGFHHLSGLFASNNLNHAAIAMTIRQAAYLFGLVRRMDVARAIEIGRYKGGSTLLIAAAMGPGGRLWSIDLGVKEERLRSAGARPFREQIEDMLARLSLTTDLIDGDSRTIEVSTGEVDLVFIDGDHSYEVARNDYERFGRRTRSGGALIFDDAIAYGAFGSHADTVGLLVEEIISEGDFRLVSTVDRLAHLERV